MSEKKIEKTLSATLRKEDFGSAGSRRLVRAGFIPAVIYGKTLVHVVINAKEFAMKRHMFSESTLIEVNVEGEVHRVFVKTYQEDLLRGTIKHIDFYEVTAGHMVKTHVRIELQGSPVGCKVGGVLDQVIHEIEIECLPKDLPNELVADVSGLEINESLRLSDVKIPATIKVLSDLNATVASVKAVKEEAEVASTDANPEPVVTTAAAPADEAK
jgi:ribosomal protein L25, Ctc-form